MKTTRGKVFSVLCFVLLVIAIALPSAAQQSQENTLDEVLSRGVLRVGAMLDWPPGGYRDAKGQPAGLFVDLAERMAKDLGVKLEIVETAGANRIPALVAKRVDVCIAGLTITPERAKVVHFSIPMERGAMVAMVLSKSAIKQFSDLKGKTAGTVRGTTPEIGYLEFYEKWKKENPSTKYISYDSNADQLLALKQGKVDAICENDIWFNDVIEKNPGQFKMVGPPYYYEWCGLAVRKGDQIWLNWINTWLWDLMVRGDLEKIYKKSGFPYWPVTPAYVK